MATATPDLCSYALTTIHHKARQLDGRYGFTTSDIDDIEQDLAIDLLVRLRRFDATKACRTTFIARIVDHRIANLIRNRSTAKRDCRRRMVSLSGGSSDSGDETDSVTVTVVDPRSHHDIRSRDLRLDVAALMASLPDELQAVATRLHRMSQADIAREFGWSSRHIKRVMAALRQRFATAGFAPRTRH